MPSQAKISLFSKQCPRSPTPKTKMKILVAAVVGIQNMLILEEVLMGEGHYNGKLFGAAWALL